MLSMKAKRGNKGKLLYVCRDCQARKYVRTIYSNRRGGPKCMECGGVLDPDSANATSKAERARSRSNEEETGSLRINHH
jgi:ribosomal protein S27E